MKMEAIDEVIYHAANCYNEMLHKCTDRGLIWAIKSDVGLENNNILFDSNLFNVWGRVRNGGLYYSSMAKIRRQIKKTNIRRDVFKDNTWLFRIVGFHYISKRVFIYVLRIINAAV